MYVSCFWLVTKLRHKQWLEWSYSKPWNNAGLAYCSAADYIYVLNCKRCKTSLNTRRYWNSKWFNNTISPAWPAGPTQSMILCIYVYHSTANQPHGPMMPSCLPLHQSTSRVLLSFRNTKSDFKKKIWTWRLWSRLTITIFDLYKINCKLLALLSVLQL